MTSEYGTPLIETVFVAGGFLVIPLLLWSLDIISVESVKEESVDNEKNNKASVTMGQTEAYTQLKSKIAEVQSLCTIDLS